MRYVFGAYTLDTRQYELRRGGVPIPLRHKVFHLLAYLLTHRDRIIPRQELCEHLWPKQFVSDATLDACLAQARQVVGDSGRSQRVIQTRHGYGYRFVAAVEICPEARLNDAAVVFPLAPSEEPAGHRVPDAASHLVPSSNALSKERGIVPHNLPLQLTSFIGRTHESAEVQRLLSMARLLTLSGPGGCGKTRLAFHVATGVVDTYPDGVWVVELAPLFDPTLVLHSVAAVLGVREEPHRPLLASLTAARLPCSRPSP